MLCTRQLKFYTVTRWNGKRVTVFAITIGAGDSILVYSILYSILVYSVLVNGIWKFLWEICAMFNTFMNSIHFESICICTSL